MTPALELVVDAALGEAAALFAVQSNSIECLELASCAAVKANGGKGSTDQFGNSYCEGETYSVNPVQINPPIAQGNFLKAADLDAAPFFDSVDEL